MYANFFGLRSLPFEDRADPQFTVPSGELEETLAALEYETHYKRGMALTVGAAGVGKTQMIRALLLRLHTTDHAVVLTRNAADQADLIRETCKGFGVSLGTNEDESRLITRLRRHLNRNAKANHSSVLIIDNAEDLTDTDFQNLAVLHELNEKTVNLLSIILVAQPRILELLERPGLERMKQNLFGHRTITALQPDGVDAYIRHRLKIAGAAETDIFATDTIDLIHRITGGVPRLINQVCHSAMIAAYGSDERKVTRTTIADITNTDAINAATTNNTRVIHQRSIPTSDIGIASPTPAPMVTAVAGDSGTAWNDRSNHDLPGISPESASTFGYADPADNGYSDLVGSEDYDVQSRLERSLAQAERVSATTDAKLAQFAAVERHLTSLAESAERLIAGLSQTTEHANRSFANAQQRMEAVLAKSERRINDVDSRVTQAIEVSSNLSGIIAGVGSECERAEDVGNRLGAYANQLESSMDEMETRAAPLLDAAESALAVQDRLEKLQLSTDQITEHVETTIAKFERKLDGECARTIERAQTKIDSLNTTIETSRTQCTEVESAANAAIDLISNASLQVGHLNETAKTVGNEANALITRVHRVRDEASPLVERAEATVTKIERAQLDAETLRVSVTDRLIDLGRACEQTEVLGKNVEACTGTVEKLLRNREWIDTTVAKLDTKVNAAQKCVEALTTGDAGINRIAKVLEQAQKTTAQIETASEKAERIADRTSTIEKKLSETLGSSGGQLERILQTVREGSLVTEQLTDLNKTGAELHDALQGLVAHTDEKIGRLDSHSAAAGRILRELSEANKTAHGLIAQGGTQVNAAKQAATETIAKIETLTNNVDSLTEKTESLKSDLGKQFGETTRTVETLKMLTEPAQAVAGTLSKQVEQAQLIADTLDDRSSSAQSQLDAIEDITPLLESVRDADESVRSSADEIQGVRHELAEALDEAEKQTATLDSLNNSANTLIETQCQLAERMVDMSQTFDDKIVDTKTAMATGEELLREFTNQAGTINHELNGLTTRTKSLEENVDQVTEKRNSVLKSAEAQTAHLEKVTVAVRKVFAGVSKATLEARDQTELLRQAEGSSSEQLITLTTRTQQAAATLQEWVEEAVRVQTRLERAVGQAPTIQQTHPKATLQGLGDVVSAAAQSVRTLDAPIVMQNKSTGANAPSAIAAKTPNPTATNIAKLLEEAKQAKTIKS